MILLRVILQSLWEDGPIVFHSPSVANLVAGHPVIFVATPVGFVLALVHVCCISRCGDWFFLKSVKPDIHLGFIHHRDEAMSDLFETLCILKLL